MANLLQMKGKQPHKMYIKYQGELRQVKYAYYNGQQVYSCYEPPIITGVRLNISKTTLTNTDGSGSTSNSYIIGNLIDGVYVFTIPACQCTINDIAIKWTQDGPDGECGSGSNYYTIATASEMTQFIDGGTTSYYDNWSFNDYIKSYDNLNDTDNSNSLDLGISGSFQIIVNDELSSNVCNFKYVREKNIVTKAAKYNNTIPTLTINKTNSYQKETLTFSGLSATLRWEENIYTSTYQKDSTIVSDVKADLYVKQDNGDWTKQENNSQYEVTTSTYHNNSDTNYKYDFKVSYSGLDTTFNSNIVTFTQNADKMSKSTQTSWKYTLKSYTLDPPAKSTLTPESNTVTLTAATGSKESTITETWNSGTYIYDAEGTFRDNDILSECALRSYVSGSTPEFNIDETGYIATYNSGSVPWIYVRWIYGTGDKDYKESSSNSYTYKSS